MSVLCILQARVSSTRLPGKVLKPILGEPMLARQIDRIARAERVDGLTVATSDQASDDGVAALCERLGVECYRGGLPRSGSWTVSTRRGRTVRTQPCDAPDGAICPLTDPAILDALVELHLAGGFEYSSNVREERTPTLTGSTPRSFVATCSSEAWPGLQPPHMNANM